MEVHRTDTNTHTQIQKPAKATKNNNHSNNTTDNNAASSDNKKKHTQTHCLLEYVEHKKVCLLINTLTFK